jgi:hypothetical protein
MDEIRITLLVPRGLGKSESRAIRRALDSPSFRRHFRRAVREVVRRFPSLRHLRLRIYP